MIPRGGLGAREKPGVFLARVREAGAAVNPDSHAFVDRGGGGPRKQGGAPCSLLSRGGHGLEQVWEFVPGWVPQARRSAPWGSPAQPPEGHPLLFQGVALTPATVGAASWVVGVGAAGEPLSFQGSVYTHVSQSARHRPRGRKWR